ncbi:hypothetical protein [Methanonatronarchaeum sp. AMET-Sl]|uniref:hypothetical protein n=1 Tax=Methanonatronarchaeum sp. AMET-Sl TaxID=3037654 RepID=UPI00244DB015|nr:hypothetical protein [Methanonatronarchaeum sp. AMET-Sl]WGI17699.1 hypothetical protein QEN48_01440 [Methanonatronarchaeum sp. AMET-Sl]
MECPECESRMKVIRKRLPNSIPSLAKPFIGFTEKKISKEIMEKYNRIVLYICINCGEVKGKLKK